MKIGQTLRYGSFEFDLHEKKQWLVPQRTNSIFDISLSALSGEPSSRKKTFTIKNDAYAATLLVGAIKSELARRC
jgi:hypothetical protein